MGCPDWPRCFGLWIPPVSISEIPAEFWNHPLSSENGKVIFNPVKTWTEYLNRLLGVLIGFSILVQAVASLFLRGKKERIVAKTCTCARRRTIQLLLMNDNLEYLLRVHFY